MRDSVAIWGVLGIPFIIVSGSALHFAFGWSGYWTPVAIVAAANESVWEHLKLAFWPGLLWASLESWSGRLDAGRYWAAKGLALFVAPLLIVSLFYSYTSFIGRNWLTLDITIFVIAVAGSQLISIWLLQSQALDKLRHMGIGALIIQLTAFSTFTYFPPPFSIFEDTRNGMRGIPADAVPLPMNHTGSGSALNP